MDEEAADGGGHASGRRRRRIGGERLAPRLALAARARAQDLRRPGDRLHAAADRDHRRSSPSTTPQGRYNFTWQGFTIEYWAHPFAISELTDAFGTSLKLAVLATLISTVIGTLMAIALVRHEFFGRRGANLLIVIPMATPEVVIGAALLSMFLIYGLRSASRRC